MFPGQTFNEPAPLPWWTLSPSPWTLLFWGLLAAWTAHHLVKSGLLRTRRLKWFAAVSESVFFIGFFVLQFDAFWIVCSALKWGPLYPWSETFQLILCLGRDAAGLLFCSLFIFEYFKDRRVRPNVITLFGYETTLGFIVIWFILAESPAYTDWTFALRYGFPVHVAIVSFTLSHVLGRALWSVIYFSVWDHQK